MDEDHLMIPERSDGAQEVPIDQSTPSEKPVSIVYEVQWTHAEFFVMKSFRSEVPLGPLEVETEDLGALSNDSPRDKPAIEVKTSIRGTVPKRVKNHPQPSGSRRKKDSNSSSSTSDPAHSADEDRNERFMSRLEEPIHFKDIRITQVEKTSVIIHDIDLLREIRSVVQYFPAQNLTGDHVEILEPEKSEWTCKHLAALLHFLEQSVGPRIDLARSRLSKPNPTVTFDDLWILFKPGIDVYSDLASRYDVDNALYASVVIETVNANISEEGAGNKDRMDVYTWGLESDGSTIKRQSLYKHIDWYKGEREVMSLPIFPSRFQDQKDGGKRRRMLEERGERVHNLMRSQPKQMWYDGLFLTTRKEKYRGTAVIDSVAADTIAHKDFSADENYGYFDSEITFHSEHSDMVGQTLETFVWAAYHSIDITAASELPSKHHYLLFQPFLPGFALYDKTWRLFNIHNLTDVQFEVDMSNLIIDEGNRDIVQAICHANSHPCRIDYISNKGEGQVALLHGPPGVGKTYTVECIAQATGRPLIALTIGDLMEEDQIENRLEEWFSLAQRWQAILLLDEADIFLERRATRDIQRNGIVSIFLRRMEYFRGLLFLTTNRVGQIDDAFLSRVTAVLQYDHLTDDTRKRIWEGFFRRLQKDGERKSLRSSDDPQDNRKVEVDKYARKYVLNDEQVKRLKWNGREIRNALQTAISLASYKAQKDGLTKDVVEVEEDHFKSVVAMSGKFKDYMERIYNKDEAQRARGRFERDDGPQSRLIS
ncbi:MAG: hypothetical protein Q9166_001793 [cf. Caloplaca sp. 2 TL-2023]